MFISPTVVGQNVIAGSCAGSLYALDRADGTPTWLYDTKVDGSPAQFHGEPLLLGERVIVPTDSDPRGHLYAFDIASGDVIWKIPFDQGVATTPLFIDGRIITVSMQGEIVAIDPKDGNIVWRVAPAGTLKPMPFIQSPAFAGGRIFVADNTNRLFALNAATGATLWQKTLPDRANTTLVVVGNALAVGTFDGYMNWLDQSSGEMQKRVLLNEGRPYGTPILASQMLYILAAGAKGSLLALDAATGAVRWKRETAKEWTTFRPLVTSSTIIVGDEEKNLCAFNAATGTVQWCRSIGQVPRGLGVSSGILYVGSLSGVVQAFSLPKEDQ